LERSRELRLQRPPPLPPLPSLARRGIATALLVVAATACGASHDDAQSPASSLPSYSPEAAVLFDDVLAPAVFGFDPEGRTPAKDPKLKDRTRLAEFVVVARVETVSRVGGVEHHGAYEITLDPIGAALAGDTPSGPILLNVPATNPSYTWVDGAGAHWVGSRLIVFGRHYRDDRVPTLHFRCEPDTPDMRAAVDRNAGLRLLR
jgi:hypothetical protein